VTHIYEIRPRKDKHGIDLISDVLPFGRLWYETPDHAIGYAMHSSRSHDAVIRVYDDAGNLIETLKYKAEFHKAVSFCYVVSRRHRVERPHRVVAWEDMTLEGSKQMPKYLFQGSYTEQGLKGVLQEGGLETP